MTRVEVKRPCASWVMVSWYFGWMFEIVRVGGWEGLSEAVEAETGSVINWPRVREGDGRGDGRTRRGGIVVMVWYTPKPFKR